MTKPPLSQRLLFALFMSLCMSICMSFVMTWVNTGIDAQFVSRWLRSWCVGLVVAYPTAILFNPVAMKLTHLFTRKNQENK